MKISKNMYVSLSYTLRSESHEGEVVEATEQDYPLEFICGLGMMLPKFEEAILGLEKGASFKIEIPFLEGYGPSFDDRIVELPKSIFEKDGVFDSEMVEEGNILPMMDSNGGRLNGKVLSVGEEVVTMDFNHPMAGQDLYFTGSILDVRKATEEDMAKFTHGGCGCGCGCGDSCGDDCGDDHCGCDSKGCCH